MRLLSLYISDYQVLSRLKINFDQYGRILKSNRPYQLDFLVGVNGSGKSTVLRALGEIFRYLGSDTQKINFGFEVEYWHEIRNQRVRVTNLDSNTEDIGETRVFVANGLDSRFDLDDPKELIWIQTPDVDGVKLLPSRVIAYTTGSESDWELSRPHSKFDLSNLEVLRDISLQELALREQVAIQEEQQTLENTTTKFFHLIPKERLPIVALCGLLNDAAQPNESQRSLIHVFKEAKIQNFPGFSLCFDLINATFPQRQEIYTRLASHASRKIRNGSEVRLIFNLTNFAKKLKEEFGSGLEFYDFLSSLTIRTHQVRPVLKEVSIFIERSEENGNKPPLHTWDWLSDGERSFLGRMCLFLLFGNVDALILLDEPEVHFNDYWKRHIVWLLHNILTKNMVQHSTSHLLIATHSSIALTDVHPEDIIILSRKGLKTDTSDYPQIQTFGADPGDIMVHVFGTPYATGQHSIEECEDLIMQARRGTISRKELQARIKNVAPGYWSYRLHREMLGMQ